MEYTYLLAFTAGLFGAFHCLGMCSGLAGGFFTAPGWQPGIKAILIYHGMRIATYTLLGVLGATLGQVLVLSGLLGKAQGFLMLFSGLIITIIAILLFKRAFNSHAASCKKGNAPPATHKIFWHKKHPNAIWMGITNGLVPCSLVFSIAIQATATASPLRASLLMLSFGIGTLPIMLTLSSISALTHRLQQRVFKVLTAISVFLLGLWTLYEGWIFIDVMIGLA